MTRLTIAVVHLLSQEEALVRVKLLIGEAKAQYAGMISGFCEEWSGATGTFRFTAMGLPVSGIVVVKSASVECVGDLPLAASFFKERIEAEVRKRVAAKLVP